MVWYLRRLRCQLLWVGSPAARRPPPPPTHTPRPATHLTQWRVLGLGTHTGHHTLGSGGGGEEVAEAAIATNNSIS